MKQERAVITRGRLTQAAAGEFARCGYVGTSLQKVCRLAGVSMGALTFHFSSKGDLASDVAEAGAAEIGVVVSELGGGEGDPLATVSFLTCELVSLLARSPAVRAAARLEREQVVEVGRWSAEWESAVRRLLELARRRGDLTAGVEVDTVLQLARHLLDGSTVALCSRSGEDEVSVLTRIWDAAVRGIRVTAL